MISIRLSSERQQHENTQDVAEHKRARYTHRKRSRKPTSTVQIPHITQCPICGCNTLSTSSKTTARTLIDLTFTKNGVRKSITKYWAYKRHCPTCGRAF